MSDSVLTEEMRKEIVELTIKTYQEEMERQRKLAHDKRLRNTKLLLINYRGLLSHSESAIYEASKCDEDVYEILDTMTGGRSDQLLFVDSIKRSAGRTRLILEHIKKAIADYERYCVRTGKEEEMRRCRTIKRMYIEDKIWEAQDIADQELVDISTVYKDIREAIRRLTPRIFGIDGLF